MFDFHSSSYDCFSIGVENNDDCDDVNAERYLGANEYCNGLDDDCDGEVDEEDAVDKEVFYYDGDGDGHGISDVSLVISACPVLGEASTSPEGYSSLDDDCDDENADVAPSLPELCSEDIDEDCDGENTCLLYTSPSPRDKRQSRMPSSA